MHIYSEGGSTLESTSQTFLRVSSSGALVCKKINTLLIKKCLAEESVLGKRGCKKVNTFFDISRAISSAIPVPALSSQAAKVLNNIKKPEQL